MTKHEELIGKIDKLINQAQHSIDLVQSKLNDIIEVENDPKILADVINAQTRAVKTLAEAARTLNQIRDQGEQSSDTDWLKAK